jgi:hypothetical protein
MRFSAHLSELGVFGDCRGSRWRDPADNFSATEPLSSLPLLTRINICDEKAIRFCYLRYTVLSLGGVGRFGRNNFVTT